MQQPNQQPPGIGFFDQNAQPPQYSAILGQFNQQGQVRPGYQQNQPGFQPPNQSPYPQNNQQYRPDFPLNQPGYQQPGFAPNQQNYPGLPPNQLPFQPQSYGPSAPNFPQNPQPYNNQYGGQQKPQTQWNVNDYLRKVFMEIDADRNNFLTPNELQIALSKLQPSFAFDMRTIDFVIQRFDSNRDNRISFDEFQNFYLYLNDEYATFIMNDINGNETIEANELANTLSTRLNASLNPQTLQFILGRVEQILQRRINFDIFCRVNARFDILCRQYRQQRPQMPIDQFLMQHYFDQFF